MQVKITAKDGASWVNVSHPTPDELAALVREANVTPLDAEFIAQRHNRAEITMRDDYLLLLIHVPVFNRQTRVTTGAPLYCIVRPHCVWTLQYEAIPALDAVYEEFSRNAEMCEEYLSDGPLGLALHLMHEMYVSALRKLDRLTKQIAIAEDAIFHGNEQKMVEEVAVLTRDVMDFRSVMRPQQQLFATVPEHPLISAAHRTQWERLQGAATKIWDVLESLYESTRELSNTNATLLQHKQAQLLRLLMYYSTVSIPILTLLTPINPIDPATPAAIRVLYWSLLGFLVISLSFIFWRYHIKKAL